MRVVLAPAGSRGDFQPLLALGLGLRAAGHDVVMATSPSFVAEVRAFGLEARTVGLDAEAFVRESGFAASPLAATYDLFKIGRAKVREMIVEGLPLMRGADVVVGAGAQIAAPTIAEALGVPYVFVAYTPQALWSSHHPPFTFPLHGLPRFANRALWRAFSVMTGAVFAGPINAERCRLGLAPVHRWYEHFFPPSAILLASDPELAGPAPDSFLAVPPTGALHLPDTRPLSAELERFLAAGPPPVYVGFGSMPDKRPAETTRLIVAAARSAGARLVLSRGWAGFGAHDAGAGRATKQAGEPLAGGESALGADVFVAGPSSHALLFPRVAAVVHHGGAGTTAASARAGRPQVVIPHIFDQFQWARWVHAAGLAPPPLARGRLTGGRLVVALSAVLREASYRTSAHEVGAKLRSRDSTADAIAAIEKLTRTGPSEGRVVVEDRQEQVTSIER